MGALCGKGFCYSLLRHDGSIEGGGHGLVALLNELLLGAERAGSGRIDEGRVPGVADADNGGVAVVGIRVRGLAVESDAEASVGTRLTASR